MKDQKEPIQFHPSVELLNVSEMNHRSGSQIYAHERKSFGLICVLSGSAIYDFDGVPYPVKEGDIFCIPQKFPFSLRPIQKCTYQIRQFGLMINDPALNERMRSVYPPITVDPTLKAMLDYIFKFWNIPSPENRQLLEIYLRAILSQFYIGEMDYHNPVSSFVITDGYCPATRKALCYVETNRHKRFSLTEMGRSLGYNKNYLCSAFSQDTGISITDYVHFQKIRQAMAHFFYWGTSLEDVCELLSFGNVSYFSTVFKATAGLSPGAFRAVCQSLDVEERTKINGNTSLFVSRPVPMEELFADMRKMGNIMKEILQRKTDSGKSP